MHIQLFLVRCERHGEHDDQGTLVIRILALSFESRAYLHLQFITCPGPARGVPYPGLHLLSLRLRLCGVSVHTSSLLLVLQRLPTYYRLFRSTCLSPLSRMVQNVGQ